MRTHIFSRNLSFFYVFATLLLVLGFMGIALGTYVQFFRPASPGELMLNMSLFLYSIGLVFSALIHFGAFGTIKKLSKRE
jgi:hypothetical protein